MSLIDVQKLSNGTTPSGGKLYIGTYGSNEPEVSPVTVYTDAALTAGIDISTGADLDQDGFPLVNGVRTSLYIGVNYSLQIRDRNGAPIFVEARQLTVTEQAAGSFDPDSNITFNGDCEFTKELVIVPPTQDQSPVNLKYFNDNSGGISSIISTEFSVDGVYTKNASMKYCRVRAWGAGGSGAKLAAGSGAGGGGGGGGYAEKIFSNAEITAPVSVTVGVGGAQQTSAGSPGVSGTGSSFGLLLDASGGSAGELISGGLGGGAAFGSLVATGIPGGDASDVGINGSGSGGAGALGSGGGRSAAYANTGKNGEKPGGGGGGSPNFRDSGSGGAGFVIVEEYI